MKMYTVKEVALILNLSTETIRRYLRNGVLKGFNNGGAWRISEDQLLKYIEGE